MRSDSRLDFLCGRNLSHPNLEYLRRKLAIHRTVDRSPLQSLRTLPPPFGLAFRCRWANGRRGSVIIWYGLLIQRVLALETLPTEALARTRADVLGEGLACRIRTLERSPVGGSQALVHLLSPAQAGAGGRIPIRTSPTSALGWASGARAKTSHARPARVQPRRGASFAPILLKCSFGVPKRRTR